MEWAWIAWERVRHAGRRFGLYVLPEMLLPGGTLIALLVFAWRHDALCLPNRRNR